MQLEARRGALGPQELELHMIVSHPVGVLWKSSQCSQLQGPLASSKLSIFRYNKQAIHKRNLLHTCFVHLFSLVIGKGSPMTTGVVISVITGESQFKLSVHY